MESNHKLAGAAARAAIVAGPLFLSLLLLLDFQQSVPATVDATFVGVVRLIVPIGMFMILSAGVGWILAFPTCAAVGSALCFLADQLPLARPLVVWIAVGAGIAVALVHFIFDGLGSSGGYAFVGTAMACAAIVRCRLRWE